MAISRELRQDWEMKIAKHSGSYEERRLIVPYTLRDTHEAALLAIRKLNFLKVFEQDPNSPAMLFGQDNIFVARVHNFKGMIIIDPVSANQTAVYVKIKRFYAATIVQQFFNEFTKILEKRFQRADAGLNQYNAQPDVSNMGGGKSALAVQNPASNVGGGKSAFASQSPASNVGQGNPNVPQNVYQDSFGSGVETDVLGSQQYKQKQSNFKTYRIILYAILILIIVWRLIIIASMN